jgi:resolvase-like protein
VGWVYLRVSTDNQTTDKRRELEAVAARSGWDVVGIYEDAGITGAKGQEQRPDFDVCSRMPPVIAAWSVDRLGRSMQHLVGLLMDLQAPEISALGIAFEEYILVEEKTGEEGKARGAHRAGVGSNRPFPYLEG